MRMRVTWGDGGGVESTGWREEGHASGPDVGYVKFKRGNKSTYAA